MNPRQSYREGAVQGASPLRLVVLLYEQAIEDLRRALAAQGAGNIEERTRQINHAILVIGHLQAVLDKEQGGAVAANLERFYNLVRAGLVAAQFRQSASAIEEQIAHLVLVYEAWSEAERSSVAPLRAATKPAPSAEESESRSLAEWNA